MIVIIGSGIIGLFIANELLESGKKVTILNLKKKASATSASVGMLAPLIESKPYEKELFDLMLDSKALWDKKKQYKSESKIIGLKNNSSMLVAQNSDDLEEIQFKKKFIDKLGYKTELLNKNETLKIEPNLNSNIEGSLYCKNNNQVEPRLLESYLRKSIFKKGGEIKTVENFEKFIFKKNKLIFNEYEIKAEKIVICCGAWSNLLLKNSMDISFKMRPLKGVSMIFETNTKMFDNNLWFKKIYIAPRQNNQIAVGATEDEKGFEEDVTLDEILYLSKYLWESFPEIEKFKFKKISAGLRSAVVDGNPIIGKLNLNKDVICSFGHYRHGILLAPITASIVTDYVLEKKIPNKYCFFSPKRFNL